MENESIIKEATPEDRFLILGYGVTGKAIAAFFDREGLNYFIFDDAGTVSDVGAGFQKQFGSVEELGSLIERNIKAVIPSPGVSLTHPVAQKANAQKVPMIGELELASFYLEGDFIAVTGTNGKSTTVKLINALLKDSGIENSLKGNFGSPLITAVNEPPAPFYVVEESSYQLELVGGLRHRISVCLNVSDDHLDRYPDLKAYSRAKENVILNSGSHDVFIYNADDRFCLGMAKRAKRAKRAKVGSLLPLSLVNKFEEGGFVDSQEMVIRRKGQEWRFPLARCALLGMHNQENMLAALLVVTEIASSDEVITSYRHTLSLFKGLPHRLQKVASLGGVDYFDDSKATNVGAVVMALASFHRPIVLIAGGRDKQGDYAPLKGLIQGKVKKLILMGEAQELMAKELQGTTDIALVHDMKEAVQVAHESVKEDDVVLFSPACSSFDQYENYMQRGDDFKQQVLALGGTR